MVLRVILPVLLMLSLLQSAAVFAASCVNGPVWLGGNSYAGTLQAALGSLSGPATLLQPFVVS
jgi:hypothetical protein